MELIDIFHLMAILTCLTVIFATVYIAYQAYLVKKFLTEKVSAITDIGDKLVAARYSTQYAVTKFLLNLLGKGGEKNE